MPNKTIKNPNLSVIKKTFIIFSVIIIIMTVYYCIMCKNSSTSNIKLSVATLIRSSEITSDQCSLSMKESDGWFCELDSDWNRRKTVHYATR